MNLGCIDQNPWMSRAGNLDHPDWMLLDLDPVETSFDQIVEAALLVRELLDELGLKGYPKTTGGDGMHVYVPLEPIYTYEQVRSFAELLSHLAVDREPNLLPRRAASENARKAASISTICKSEPAKPSPRRTWSAPMMARQWRRRSIGKK